jgi:hypothetical protein
MNESDPLDALLREWKTDEPAEAFDQRVIAAYRSTTPAARPSSPWTRFWTMRISIPAPALVAAALAALALVLWLRPSAAPASPEPPGAVTRLNVNGFLPLPNGDARIVPALEVQR